MGWAISWWSPASDTGLATDSMRESIHALRCELLCLQDTQSKRPVELAYNCMRISPSDKNGRLCISRTMPEAL